MLTRVARGRQVIAVIASAAVVALLAGPAARANPGDADVDFGGTGTVVLSTTGSFPEKFAVDGAVDASGRVLTAGTAASGVDERIVVTRLRPDGGYDTSFAAGSSAGPGRALIKLGNFGTPLEVALLPDGKVAVAGNGTGMAVPGSTGIGPWPSARLTASGVLDSTYSGDGIFGHPIGEGSDGVRDLLTQQSDGKLLAAGSASLGGQNEVALARYTTAGTLDSSFSFDGLVAVQLPGTGRDEVTGLACATPAGTGRVCASGSKLLVAAEAEVGVEARVVVARFNADGTIDHTFGSGGSGDVILGVTHRLGGTGLFSDEGSLDEHHLIDVDSSGRILVGDGSDLYRLTPDGVLDPGFAGTGRIVFASTADLTNVIATPQDGALAALEVFPSGGDGHGELRRFNSAGVLDGAFGNGGVVPLAAMSPKRVTIAGGKLVVAGTTTDPQHNDHFLPVVMRLLDEVFTLNPTFLPGLGSFTLNVSITVPTAIGILVQRRVHGHLVTVGRVPLGRRHAGRNRIRWDLRVNRRRLAPGTYFVRVRLLDAHGHVYELTRPIRIRVPRQRHG
jgi:uncharacterized delta-60 repeat protein